jgi:hypothetical protein
MKHLFVILIALTSLALKSQSDTLILRSKQKLAVKLIEISEFEIKYKRLDMPDGPIYTTNNDNILKLKYANGTEQVFMRDELAVQQDVHEILKQKEVFKFHVFDLPTGKISFGYERVLRTGINTDFKFGFFSSDLFSSFNNNSYPGSGMFNPFGARSANGTFVKGGIKFLLGEDFTLKGMRYAHPLNGRFIRFDVYISYINYNDIRYQISAFAPTQSNPYPAYIDKTTNASSYNYGFLINYGRQFVLGNIMTLEYYIGVGFNGSSYSFTQSDYGVNGPIDPNNMYSNYRYPFGNTNLSNVLAAQRLGKYLSGTLGFSIGYIHKKKEHLKSNPKDK